MHSQDFAKGGAQEGIWEMVVPQWDPGAEPLVEFLFVCMKFCRKWPVTHRRIHDHVVKTVSQVDDNCSSDCADKQLSWMLCCRPVIKYGYIVVERWLQHQWVHCCLWYL